jgi:type II secretory pathway component GspD/PulD (secretin)
MALNAHLTRKSSAYSAWTGLLLASSLLLNPAAQGQPKPEVNKPDEAKPSPAQPPESKPVADSYKTFYLTNVTQQNEMNDIQTDMRNLLPRAKIYGVPTQNAISLRASAEDLALAEKIIADLDRHTRTYRVTYTLTDFDGAKRLGSEHYSLLVTSGERTDLKQGTRIPVVTGTTAAGTASANTQVQYIDVGLSIYASLYEHSNGVRLHTKVERSSSGDSKIEQEPEIRQTTLESTQTLTDGKPLQLGSLDVPGSTHRQEVEVTAEVVK